MDEILYLVSYFGLLIILAPLLGVFLAWVLERENQNKSMPDIVERWILQFIGITPNESMQKRDYWTGLLLFHFLGASILFSILIFQKMIFWNPLGVENMTWHLAFNTTISFITNTNWQAYSGESQLSYFSQCFGLTTQNFLSAAVGIQVLTVVSRSFSAKKEAPIGNLWRDLYRIIFYVLLPLSILLAIALMGEGVVQSFASPISLIENGTEKMIPLGPAASQIAIKQLGTNGGGFFGVNSAHPFENPTPLSNFLQLFSILLIPASCVFLFGKIIGNLKHSWIIFFVMLTFIFISYGVVSYSEAKNPQFFEGKEIRFSKVESGLWLVATTAASNGSVNSMHDSYSPLSGMVAMTQMFIGEVIFGGVGAGMYGMVLFMVLTVFLCGLMTGKTPEYLGRKIQKTEITWALIGIFVPTISILIGVSNSLMFDIAKESINAKGPHALSQIVYAFTSASQNNGSAFAGFGADTIFMNLALSICMLLGRFSVMISVLMVGFSFREKTRAYGDPGNFEGDTVLFGILVFTIITIVAGLSFFPILAVGPVLEELLMRAGRVF